MKVATYAAGLLAYSAGMLFAVSLSAASAALVTASFHAATVFTSTEPSPAFANVANLYGVYVWPSCALLTCSNGVVACAPETPRAIPPSSVAAAAMPAKSFLIFMRILFPSLSVYLFLQSREAGSVRPRDPQILNCRLERAGASQTRSDPHGSCPINQTSRFLPFHMPAAPMSNTASPPMPPATNSH